MKSGVSLIEKVKLKTVWKSLLIMFVSTLKETSADWNFWWTFDGISGPEFWGILNPDWHLCSKGHRQSPIDIKPNLLLYDPNLRSIHINKHRINGILENNGHSVVFHLNNNQQESETSNSINNPSSSQSTINISGGPLSYSYSFHSLHLHFGRTDAYGSEHSIAGLSFPGEIQLLGYNSELYQNMSEASTKPNGLVGISLLLQVGEVSSVELRLLTSQLQHIRYRACLHYSPTGEAESPKAPLGNNFRPSQPLNERVVRTNIDFKRQQGTACPTMKKNLHYEDIR